MQSIETLLAFTEAAVYAATGEHLSDLQRLILQELWQNNKKTYGQIAIEHSYSGNYIQQVAAPRLWRLLSRIFGQKVTKSNLRRVLEQYFATQSSSPTLTSFALSSSTILSSPTIASYSDGSDDRPDQYGNHPNTEQGNSIPNQWLEHPSGSVSLNSPFYVLRPQDALCYQTILQPHSLIQIKAPRQMGKTSLLTRMLAQANRGGCRSVIINFQQADREILSDLQKLLRWLCTCISRQLDLEPQLAICWDEELGHKISCTLYLEEQILRVSQTSIVVALEEMSELFEYPAVTQDLFTMIRGWHELMKKSEPWQKLRLIMVYSTELALPLHISQLPFNVGIEVILQPFTREQVEDLIQRHGLEFSSKQVTQLMDATMGHPYLVRSTLYSLAQQEVALETVLDSTCFKPVGHENL